ncbi:MAG: hypothetical protein WCK47_00425 [bacterium]|nr:hypothetical protein [Candidatus Sumerlaeota bacterium]
MKQFINVMLFAFCMLLLAGCSYFNDGSWEISGCGNYVSYPARYPAPSAVRSWNYPWEVCRDPFSCRY